MSALAFPSSPACSLQRLPSSRPRPHCFNIGDHSTPCVECAFISSENARRGIVLLGQVPPTPTLTFVSQSRQKAEVRPRFLSENRLRTKLGEYPCTPGATIPQHYRCFQHL